MVKKYEKVHQHLTDAHTALDSAQDALREALEYYVIARAELHLADDTVTAVQAEISAMKTHPMHQYDHASDAVRYSLTDIVDVIRSLQVLTPLARNMVTRVHRSCDTFEKMTADNRRKERQHVIDEILTARGVSFDEDTGTITLTKSEVAS